MQKFSLIPVLNFLFDIGLVVFSYIVALPFEGPQSLWAPITALIVLQPTKGMTYHLGLQRLFGTIVGSMTALVLIKFLPTGLGVTIITLTTIVAFSAGMSCLGRIINGYAFQSAGFTTAIVYILSFVYKDEMTDYPLLRIGGIFIGIFVTLVGLQLIKKESERAKLADATKEVKELTRKWVRLVLQKGTSEESTILREEIVTKTNALNVLSSYASSQRFFLGSSRRRTLYVMGTIYTIISLTRAQVRKLVKNPSSEELTEQSFPEIAKLFESLEKEPPQIELSRVTNWPGAKRTFARLMVGGLTSGGLWWWTGFPFLAVFFLNTLVHLSVFSTNHRAKERVKNVIFGLTIAVFSLNLFHYFIGIKPILSVPEMLLLLMPGKILSLATKKPALGVVVMLFTLVLYSMSSSYGEKLTHLKIIIEYASFVGGVLYAYFLTNHLLPMSVQRRYRFYRYRLFLEVRRVTDLNRKLSSDWLMTMYGYIEGMLSYAPDLKMNETQIMNEGLTAIDVCVEVLEIRSQIPIQDTTQKGILMEAIPMITETKLALSERCEKLEKLAESFEDINPTISYNLRIIINKIKLNDKFFEMVVAD